MDNQLIPIIEQDGVPTIESIVMAERLGIDHPSLIKVIKKYEDKITERFQRVRFQIRPFETKGGVQNVTVAYLTEEQSYFVATLSKNSERVVEFKAELVKAFQELRTKKYTPSVTLPQTYASALRQLAQEVEEKERLETQVKELAPKAEYTDVVLQSKTSWTITTIAKELGMTAQELNTVLAAKRVQYKKDGHWLLYAKFDKKGFIETRTHVYTDRKGDVQTNISTVWTETGRNFIHLLLNPKVVTAPRELPENELQLQFSTR